MTKYRLRLGNGRVIGPFIKTQLFELKAKGHIDGTEEAQIFPTGSWVSIKALDIYDELMDENRTVVNSPESKEETFVIDIGKIRAQQLASEVESIDMTSHVPLDVLTETIHLQSSHKTNETQPSPLVEIELDQDSSPHAFESLIESKYEDTEAVDKTLINPVAQEEIEALRRRKRKEEERILKEEEFKRAVAEQEKLEREAQKNEAIQIQQDESTQMIRLDHSSLLEDAIKEEKKIAKELKQRKKTETDEVEDDDEENDGRKRKKIVIMVAVVAIAYALLFPNDDKPQKPRFEHLPPQIVFPVPYDKADLRRSQIELEKGKELYSTGTYPDIVKAGLLFKSSYENNLENSEALSFLVRSYAEEINSSKDRLKDSITVFNIVQSKRSFLIKEPNGVIGMNLFYSSIGKESAAVDVIAKYLKLNPENVSPDLFAAYLKSLMRVGRLDKATQFYVPLVKAPEKSRYVFDALIEYELLNQNSKAAHEYLDDVIKKNPKLVYFYLEKADLLIREKKFKEVEPLLKKVETLNLDYNDNNRAKYLELKGLLLAFKGNSKEATNLFNASLRINDSEELRLKLAELESNNVLENETGKLIAESKAIKYLGQGREFFDEKNYELALSSAAKASDVFPGHIPSEIFLSKVQLKLGLAGQAIKTLEDLIKKYPDNREVNFTLIDTYIDCYKFNDAKNRISIISSTELKESAEFASANAKLYILMGDTLQAVTWLRTSINMNPLNDEDMYLLAQIFTKRANFDEARSLLNKCMELDPTNSDYRIAYSKIVYETQDDQAAIGYLLGLMEEFGEDPKVLSEIAIFYYRAGKIKDFESYKQKIEKLPNPGDSLYRFLIKAALLDERYGDIPPLVEKLLAIEPGSLDSMMTAGKVLFEDGKLVEAAKWFKRIQEKLPTYPKVQYYIARIMFLSKDYENALKEVQKDMKDNGENDADLVLMAQIHVEKGELVEAENTFKRAQKINPKSYDALVGLADISTLRNNFDLALDLYKKAMKENSDETEIHKKIGDVYRRLGQGTLAIESYKLYLEANPESPEKGQIEAYINLMK